MKLYEWDFAPNCRRVRMFLLEKGIEIQKEECITPDIALKDPFLSKYKHAMVPMLELDNGVQLGEALAIWYILRRSTRTRRSWGPRLWKRLPLARGNAALTTRA